MKFIRIAYIFLLVIYTLSSCKVNKTISSDSYDQSKEDSIYKAKADSILLDSIAAAHKDAQKVPDTVDLKVFRLKKDTVSIIGVGDIMMGTNFPSADYLPADDGKHLMADVEEILRNADITFGNLEGVILNEGGEQKHCSNPDVCYLFRTPEKYVANLVEAGFDVMSLANNHAGDFGDEGRKNTMKVLDSAGIKYAGLLSIPYITFSDRVLKYGFVAFSPNVGTVSINDHINAKKIVQHLDSIADIVIVSFHGGAEGKDHQHVTRKREYYYGENRGNVYEFSHELIDAGADIIFGHGPHVSRAVEVYKNRFIAYSLGNFCTYARFNLSGANGIAPIMKVYTKSDGEFLKGEIIPIAQYGNGGVSLDSKKRAVTKIRELTLHDFPDGNLFIDDNGNVTIQQIKKQVNSEELE